MITINYKGVLNFKMLIFAIFLFKILVDDSKYTNVPTFEMFHTYSIINVMKSLLLYELVLVVHPHALILL